jgi:hypothetical protein
VGLANYTGFVTVTYKVIQKLDTKQINNILGEIVIGNPLTPELPYRLTEVHLTNAFFKANPNLVGQIAVHQLQFRIFDSSQALLTITGTTALVNLFFNQRFVPKGVITDLGEIEMLNPDNQ